MSDHRALHPEMPRTEVSRAGPEMYLNGRAGLQLLPTEVYFGLFNIILFIFILIFNDLFIFILCALV